jgi:hypothetical protein
MIWQCDLLNYGVHNLYLQDAINYDSLYWVDFEWPATPQNALSSLWGMYENFNTAAIEERIQNVELLQNALSIC